MATTELEQKIRCPNCEGHGWTCYGSRHYDECPVCETRGNLIIDSEKTLALPAKRKPR